MGSLEILLGCVPKAISGVPKRMGATGETDFVHGDKDGERSGKNFLPSESVRERSETDFGRSESVWGRSETVGERSEMGCF